MSEIKCNEDQFLIENDIISIKPSLLGGVNYSLEEQNTGIKWIDGKDIYCKTVDFGDIIGSTPQIVSVSHNINFSECVNIEGNFISPNTNFHTATTWVETSDNPLKFAATFAMNENSFFFYHSVSPSLNHKARATFYYTKN